MSLNNQNSTIYIESLHEKVTEALLWEIFNQVGRVVNIHLPKDHVTQMHRGYGLIEFFTEQEANSAVETMNMFRLYNKPIKVNKTSSNMVDSNVGSVIFIENLDPQVGEKMLFDIFSVYGPIIQMPKIIRNARANDSSVSAFLNFANIEASNAAMEEMNGKCLCNRPITVSGFSNTNLINSNTESFRTAQNSIQPIINDPENQQTASSPIPTGFALPLPLMFVSPFATPSLHSSPFPTGSAPPLSLMPVFPSAIFIPLTPPPSPLSTENIQELLSSIPFNRLSFSRGITRLSYRSATIGYFHFSNTFQQNNREFDQQ